MKNKIITLALITTLFITGCGTIRDKDIRDSFIKDMEGLKSYYMEGNMKITNNDDTYNYNIEVSYKKDGNYKVLLTNKANDYKQIILKNNEGVYVQTHKSTKQKYKKFKVVSII